MFVELVDFGGVRFDKTPSAKEQSTKILGLSKTFLRKLVDKLLTMRFWLKPDESADEMNESHERFRQFVVASGNSAEFLDSTKEPFHFLPHSICLAYSSALPAVSLNRIATWLA